MTAMNLKNNVLFAFIHLCSKFFVKRVNTRRKLIELFNRIKRHVKCILIYYFRKIKNIKKQIYKF